MKKFSIATAAFVAIAMSSGAAGAADAKKGKKVFAKCKACHALEAGKNKVGPSLHGLIGRKAASVEGFKYSKAMKESGLTWDEATLREYLKKPRSFLKGTRMAFAGIKKDSDMDNLMAYLKENTK